MSTTTWKIYVNIWKKKKKKKAAISWLCELLYIRGDLFYFFLFVFFFFFNEMVWFGIKICCFFLGGGCKRNKWGVEISFRDCIYIIWMIIKINKNISIWSRLLSLDSTRLIKVKLLIYQCFRVEFLTQWRTQLNLVFFLLSFYIFKHIFKNELIIIMRPQCLSGLSFRPWLA